MSRRIPTEADTIAQLSDKALRQVVRNIVADTVHMPVEVVRAQLAPYIAEVKIRVTRQTGHVFK